MIVARWPRYAAAALGFVWFLALGGLPTLNPRNIDFILAGDWRQHWLGWLFFRQEPWTFPLGKIAALPYPIGTTIGFTDSNPLMSLMLKPFSGWLAPEFQFIGPWLALCFVLQGYMGAALTSTVTKNTIHQVLGGLFFAMSTVLAARMGHDTLCAHWLLLGLLYLGLKSYDGAQAVRRGAAFAAVLTMLAAAIHPYLAAMCWVLTLAVFARLWRDKLMRLWPALTAAAATTAGILGVFAVIGYFGEAGTESPGFGIYSADILSLVDAREFSRILPGLHTPSAQWEGLGFVGLGGLCAGAIALIALVRLRPRLRTGAVMIVMACVLMAVYSWSMDVTFAGTRVAHMHGFYGHFSSITGAFRASGRFIWPLHYLALLAGIWGVTRLPGPSRVSTATALLVIVLILQGSDLRLDRSWAEDKHFRQVSVEALAPAKGHYQHMELYPMQVLGVSFGEQFTYEEDHVYRFMLEAYRLGMTFNSGIFARLPRAKMLAQVDAQRRDVEAGRFDPQTIYVVGEYSVSRLKALGAACGRFDGDWICVSRDSDEVFRTLVDTGKLIERK